MPTDIRLTPTSTVLGWFRDATSKDCSPSLADVQQFVERLHELRSGRSHRASNSLSDCLRLQFGTQPPSFDGPRAEFLDRLGRALTEVPCAVAILLEWLPFLIKTGDAIDESPLPDDPWELALGRQFIVERDGEAALEVPPGGRRGVYERALAAAESLRLEVGPPPSRGRPPATWTDTARILAPWIANVFERSGIHSSLETADGPLIAVLAQAVKAVTGKTVENEALSSALRRHPPFKGL